ncbi:MAG: hypothetical protein RXR43_14925 [Sulfolobus sp.]
MKCGAQSQTSAAQIHIFAAQSQTITALILIFDNSFYGLVSQQGIFKYLLL